MEPPKTNSSDKMIDDKAFEAMIEGEYAVQGQQVDKLAKIRIWDKLNAENNKVNSESNKNKSFNQIRVGLVLAASLAGILGTMQYFDLSNPAPYEGQRIKGTIVGIDYHIGMYLQDEDGKLTPLDDLSKKNEGDIIVPFIQTVSPAAVALVKQIGDDQYEPVSPAEMTEPGREHYFSREGEAAGIFVEPLVETYCVLVADSMPTMGQIIGSLPELKDKTKLNVECFSL
jgi:hypothetical protein